MRYFNLNEMIVPPSTIILDGNTCRANLKSIKEADEWVKKFGRLNSSTWNSWKSGQSSNKCLGWKRYVCHHASYGKVAPKNNRKGNSKNTGCEARIHIIIKKDTLNTRKKDEFIRDGFCAKINIEQNHNHSLETAEALSFLRPDVESDFIEYFYDGCSVAEARRKHENVLKDKFTGYKREIALANATINPKPRTISHWYEKWRKSNAKGLIEKLLEKQVSYSERGITVALNDAESMFCVIIVTPLMKRAANLATSVVFVDSTSACDSSGHSVTLVLTKCAAGAVPLGIIITKGQTSEEYITGFQLLRKHNDFSPAIFMTDHSKAEISAINAVWPDSKTLLSVFHTRRAVWRWLWEAKNGVATEDRMKLFQWFDDYIYATDPAEAFYAYEALKMKNEKYPNFSEHCEEYWESRETCSLGYRTFELRGNDHANNFAEISARILKENLLGRSKAYDVVSICDSLCLQIETHYARKIRNFADGGNAKIFLKSLLLKKGPFAEKGDVERIGAREYRVKNSSGAEEDWYVNTDVGFCTCPRGWCGKFCKHQAGIFTHHGDQYDDEILDASGKRELTAIALGNEVPDENFYLTSYEPSSKISLSPLSPSASTFPALDSRSTPTLLLLSPLTTPAPSSLHRDSLVVSSTSTVWDKIKDKMLEGIHCVEENGEVGIGEKILRKLNSIESISNWKSFLLGVKIMTKYETGARIKVKPASISPRRTSVIKINKRLADGRPANDESRVKRKRKII